MIFASKWLKSIWRGAKFYTHSLTNSELAMHVETNVDKSRSPLVIPRAILAVLTLLAGGAAVLALVVK